MGLIHSLLLMLAKSGKLEAARGDAERAMHERFEKRKNKGIDSIDPN